MKTHMKADMSYSGEWTGGVKALTAQQCGRFVLDKRGFTLVEILVVCAVMGILASIALPAFSELKDKANISRAIAEIRALEKDIFAFSTDAARYPTGLAEINRNNQKDPWGNFYVYYPIPDAAHTGAYPEYGGGWLNDDFDLYSKGVDGLTVPNIITPPFKNTSSDDIIRGSNGSVVELGSQWLSF